MKVYLIKTPEYEHADFVEVYNLLKKYKGVLDFNVIERGFIGQENQKFNNNYFEDFEWGQIFSLCNSYRFLNNIGETDFVVLLTARANVGNWFSAFDKNRNIFVHTDDWDRFVNTHHKYPVAYEVCANILQSLMKLDISNMDTNDYIHEPPIGCMNDFCGHKSDIILKLKTADICEVCLEEINREVSPDILAIVYQIFKGVQKQFLNIQKLVNNILPSPIIVDDNFRILINNNNGIPTEIILAPLEKAIYILFLLNSEGIKVNDLLDYKTNLINIYRILNPKELEEAKREKQIINIVDRRDTNPYSSIKSKINKKFKDILGEARASYYQIRGERNMHHKIALSHDLRNITPKITE